MPAQVVGRRRLRPFQGRDFGDARRRRRLAEGVGVAEEGASEIVRAGVGAGRVQRQSDSVPAQNAESYEDRTDAREVRSEGTNASESESASRSTNSESDVDWDSLLRSPLELGSTDLRHDVEQEAELSSEEHSGLSRGANEHWISTGDESRSDGGSSSESSGESSASSTASPRSSDALPTAVYLGLRAGNEDNQVNHEEGGAGDQDGSQANRSSEPTESRLMLNASDGAHNHDSAFIPPVASRARRALQFVLSPIRNDFITEYESAAEARPSRSATNSQHSEEENHEANDSGDDGYRYVLNEGVAEGGSRPVENGSHDVDGVNSSPARLRISQQSSEMQAPHYDRLVSAQRPPVQRAHASATVDRPARRASMMFALRERRGAAFNSLATFARLPLNARRSHREGPAGSSTVVHPDSTERDFVEPEWIRTLQNLSAVDGFNLPCQQRVIDAHGVFGLLLFSSLLHRGPVYMRAVSKSRLLVTLVSHIALRGTLGSPASIIVHAASADGFLPERNNVSTQAHRCSRRNCVPWACVTCRSSTKQQRAVEHYKQHQLDAVVTCLPELDAVRAAVLRERPFGAPCEKLSLCVVLEIYAFCCRQTEHPFYATLRGRIIPLQRKFFASLHEHEYQNLIRKVRGLSRDVDKRIDLQRLQRLYTNSRGPQSHMLASGAAPHSREAVFARYIGETGRIDGAQDVLDQRTALIRSIVRELLPLEESKHERLRQLELTERDLAGCAAGHDASTCFL
mmetsp:Transcript_12010/g.32344  ORF Transcript_12010/g.32344 Transcript_12010/m.32344 type:complete len:744 (-) Transcript_12010:1011-3242(-)|eukprot:CAMPEP_0185839988 /NCGR_PEP_ID=MMETSP1353-20130828/15509_1 /TAXON_ID=1077150 /ORGANISM="Erythrolobus australicus, Strain CCMP3124" /LENGTH=743 /DNA_ID=CAMNT_0028539245 /DNA_START=85 /DNA_END=2316 /DNA_ORIENTATION=-